MQKNRLSRLMAMAAVASTTAVVVMPTKAAPPPPQPLVLQPGTLDVAQTPTADPKIYGDTKLAITRCCTSIGKKGEIAAPPPAQEVAQTPWPDDTATRVYA